MELNWKDVESAVASAVISGAIGIPRAIRITLHYDHAGFPADMVETLLLAAQRWLGQVASFRRTREVDDTLSVTLAKWPTGQSAVISVSATDETIAGGDLILLGSRGTIYHRFSGSQL